MRIVVTSVYVDDQEKALAFYTDVLGFTKKEDVPMGEYRWLTLDAHVEYERLKGLGVRFTQPPAEMGPVVMAVFDDTCGNLIQIAQRRELS